MSEIFFRQVDIPEPNINLEVGSASHSIQTAEIMVRLEKLLLNQKPDLVLVYGDVNSTLAGALVCAKLLIPLAHVEAGLRSFDRTMPEEINRLLTDQLADLLFTHSPEAEENLVREGILREKIHFVGNVMIDTLINLLPIAEKRWDILSSFFSINSKRHTLVTLHRPSNVDTRSCLESIFETFNEISKQIKVIFLVHPRTRKNLEEIGLKPKMDNVHLIAPLGYLDFLCLQSHATLVITDSGGIQEETTYLGIPCLTLRENTERPVTITMGTNVLVGQDMELLKKMVLKILSSDERGRC
jgi:UDP-N-acetylglucosamine 2-epimerase (non-hydrolysing)